MSEIRVLHISLTKDIGGIAVYQKNLLANVDRNKYKFEYVTTYPNAMLIPYLEEMGCKVHYLPPKKKFFSLFIQLYKLMKNGNYNAVHIHKNSCAIPIAFFAAKLAGVGTIIAHAHSTSPTVGKSVVILHYLFRPFVRNISTVHLSCSQAASDWMFGKRCPAQIMNNGIDLKQFVFNETVRSEVRKELGISNELIIGHVGNFYYQKNHKFMVEIMSEVKKIYPKAKLLFVGCGDLMDEIRQYANKLGVSDSIIFLGSRSDVNRLYQAMDVFLMTSFSEGFCIAGLEAQAAGLPWLTSDVIPEEVILSDNVYTMPLNKSAHEWAEKLIEIAENSERKNNIQRISEAGYSSEDSAKKIEFIYQKNTK